MMPSISFAHGIAMLTVHSMLQSNGTVNDYTTTHNVQVYSVLE